MRGGRWRADLRSTGAAGLPRAARHQYVFGPRIDEVILRDDNLLADYAEQAGGGEAPTNLALLVESCPPPDLLVLPPEVGEAVPPCPAARRIWYHLDDQMSSVLLTNDDGVGIEGYEYTPYGKPIVYPATVTGVNWAATGTIGGAGTYANRVTYTGRSWEANTGLHYYRTRYMSPDQGRFISSDTIGTWGDVVNRGNGLAYAGNAPFRHIDPTGTHSRAFTVAVFCVKGNKCTMPCWGLEDTISKGIDIISQAIGYPLQGTPRCVEGEVSLPPSSDGSQVDYSNSCLVARLVHAWWETQGGMGPRQGPSDPTYAAGFIGYGSNNGCAAMLHRDGRGISVSISAKWVDWDSDMIVAHELAHIFGAQDKGTWGDDHPETTFMNEWDAFRRKKELDQESFNKIRAYFDLGPPETLP